VCVCVCVCPGRQIGGIHGGHGTFFQWHPFITQTRLRLSRTNLLKQFLVLEGTRVSHSGDDDDDDDDWAMTVFELFLCVFLQLAFPSSPCVS
jgi:hypothetical protein